MKYKNLYKHRVTGEYYKLDLSAKCMSVPGQSFEDRLRNTVILKFMFRPVKKGLIFLKETGLGHYDRLDNYIQVDNFGK